MLKNLIEMLLGPIVEYLYSFLSTKKKERTLSALKDDIKIYKELDSLIDEEDIDRVIFAFIHNGNNIFLPGKPKYISIIEEAKNSKVRTCLEKHQRRMIDVNFLEKLISTVFSESGLLKIRTEDMNSSIVKDLFVEEGIKEFIMAYITHSEEYVWYIFINSHTEIDEHDQHLLSKIHSSKDMISNILRKYYKIERK
jgi:hypothetical protein